MKNSPRQKLLEYAETGRLRQATEGEGQIDQDTADLLVNIVLRYCEPRRKVRRA